MIGIKFYGFWSCGYRVVGIAMLDFPLNFPMESRVTYNNLPCTTVYAVISCSESKLGFVLKLDVTAWCWHGIE
jgi:hypothetical protein